MYLLLIPLCVEEFCLLIHLAFFFCIFHHLQLDCQCWSLQEWINFYLHPPWCLFCWPSERAIGHNHKDMCLWQYLHHCNYLQCTVRLWTHNHRLLYHCSSGLWTHDHRLLYHCSYSVQSDCEHMTTDYCTTATTVCNQTANTCPRTTVTTATIVYSRTTNTWPNTTVPLQLQSTIRLQTWDL